MKRLKYPIIVPITGTDYNQIDLELPADLECEVISEPIKGGGLCFIPKRKLKQRENDDLVVKVKYIGFIVTTVLKKDNIYEAR